jgi:hypothetical protein
MFSTDPERIIATVARRDNAGTSERIIVSLDTMGDLVGIQGIRPSRRIELLPYMAAEGLFTAGNVEPGDPFHDGTEFEGRVGGDIRMGVGPNLTLEGTINPDFGQVEGDPAVANLSAFETFFDERRPFFTEGSRLDANRQSGRPKQSCRRRDRRRR